jgi:hypothetical protein
MKPKLADLANDHDFTWVQRRELGTHVVVDVSYNDDILEYSRV